MADGLLTYYCKKCGASIPPNDVIEGLAYVHSEDNSALCSECVRTPAGGTGDNPIPQAGTAAAIDDISDTQKAVPVETVKPVSRRSARPSGRFVLPNPAPVAAAPASPRSVMAAMIAGAAMVVVAGAIFFTRHRAPPPKPDVAANSSDPAWPDKNKAVRPPVTTATKTDTSVDAKKSDEDAPKDDAPQFNALPADEATLLKLSVEDFKGGKVLANLWGKGRSARSIYGTQTKTPSMSASFELKTSPDGPASVVVDTIKHGAGDPCRISISLNGHEIFEGADPASGADDEWIQHRFLVDAKILHADRNEIRFNNLENSSAADGPPCYIISSVEIRAKTP